MSNRWIAAVFVAGLLTIGVSQQGSDPGLTRAKESDVKAVPIPVPSQLPTPKSNEIVVVFETGHFVTLSTGQMFSTPKGTKFWTVWGTRATYNLDSTGQNSGNQNWAVVSR